MTEIEAGIEERIDGERLIEDEAMDCDFCRGISHVKALADEVRRLREQTCPHVEAGELLLIDELRTELERVTGDWEVAIREAAQAREQLRHIAENGLHADLTPTVMWGSEQLMYQQFANYLAQLDRSIRERAAAALDKRLAPEETE